MISRGQSITRQMQYRTSVIDSLRMVQGITAKPNGAIIFGYFLDYTISRVIRTLS